MGSREEDYEYYYMGVGDGDRLQFLLFADLVFHNFIGNLRVAWHETCGNIAFLGDMYTVFFIICTFTILVFNYYFFKIVNDGALGCTMCLMVISDAFLQVWCSNICSGMEDK